ncbi:MAG: YfhO family protein [Oscillospiraceae bacterium]|nr:YfhO family protein [Oscillospiraceae bacterium]
MEKTSFGKIVLSKKAYWLSFIIPAAILFAAYALFGVYPIGQKSVLALDLNAQYVSYFDYMYDVLGGKESIFYTWSGTLSGEFFGTFAYYLASPFNFIIWLFPREFITEGVMVMLLVKSGAVGLSAAFYLKKHRGFSDYTTILFSVMFALCGYFVAHTINPMWLDGLVALPLVIMGVERICQKRGFLLYTLSVLYIFIANYYIGYMVGIFSALYAIYYVSSRKIGGVKDYFRAVGVYTASSVSAILMSCAVIIPAFKSLQNGKLGHKPDFSFVENFNIADSFIKLFPGTYDTERPDGLPMLYCGTLALIFVLIYFMCKKIPAQQKIAGGFLLGVMTLCMYIKPVDMLWHGGQVPVWMPYRYSFTVIFLLIIFGAEAFEKIESVRPKQIGTAFLILLGVLLFSDYYAGGEHFNTTLVVVVPLIVLGIIAAFSAGFRKNHRKTSMKIALSIAVCAELLLNAGMYVYKIHGDVYYSDRDSYAHDIQQTRSIVNQVREQDGSFYRMEKTYHRTVNDAMSVGLYGFSHSTSTYNTKIINLLADLGFGARDHYSRYDGATLLTDDLFGVKYVIAKDERTVQYDEEITAANQFDARVYKNPDALPIAYLADEKAIGSSIYSDSPFMFQQRLASILAGRDFGDDLELFSPINDVVFDNKNITIGSTTDGYYTYKKRISSDEAFVSFSVKMQKSGAAYVYLPTKYERECKMFLNGEILRNYFRNENHCIVYLGDYKAGEEFKIELRPNDSEMIFGDAQFYVLDREALSEFTQTLGSQNCEVVKTGHSSFEIKVNTEQSRALFTTIPVEEGWSAELDGQPCTIASAVNDSLLCLNVPAGEHTIKLTFFPAGMKTGLIMTAAGVGMLLIMIALSLILKHVKRKKALTEQVSAEQDFDENESVPEEPETIPEFPEVPDIEDEDDAFGSIPDDFAAPVEKAAEHEVKAVEPELEEGFVAVSDEGELPVIPEDTFEEDS